MGYTCVVCQAPFRSIRPTRIPDMYCRKCFREYADQFDEPWMKYLVREEVKERVRKHRLKKHGIRVLIVPLEEAEGI